MPSEKAADAEAFVADASVRVLRLFEIANALLMLLRRKRLTPDEFARACLKLENLTPLMDDEDPRLAWNQITYVAERFGLTSYDAVYLELAIQRGLAPASASARR